MEDNFQKVLDKAVTRCKPMYSPDDQRFDMIYPFSNENILGYIPYFEMMNKSLLTVGSSGDQAINAHINKAKVETIVDICPYTKYYFYLKKSALISLTYQEFLDFFCYYDYPKTFKRNQNVFNLESYNKLREVLKKLDNESFIFWETLFKIYPPLQIRLQLFSSDEEKIKILKSTNAYLQDEDCYITARKLIDDLKPEFIIDDIFRTQLDKTYDNIWLSNIGQYHDVEKLRELVMNLENNLAMTGQILLCYLFNTDQDTPYQSDWLKIFDLKHTREILNEYLTCFKSFQGVRGILFQLEDYKDSVMIYQKVRK